MLGIEIVTEPAAVARPEMKEVQLDARTLAIRTDTEGLAV